jgi:hypothetical protein
VIKLAAKQGLKKANRVSQHLIDFVPAFSPFDVFSPATGAFGVPAQIVNEVVFGARAHLTLLTSINHRVERFFPKPPMGAGQTFATMGAPMHCSASILGRIANQ